MAKAETNLIYNIVPVDKGFILHRNATPLKTPAGIIFTLPTAELAEAVANEWRAQKDKINAAAMPFTQLAATALDIVSKDRTKTIDGIMAYADSELLCQRAEHPPELAEQQEDMWQLLLDWCAGRFNTRLNLGQGIIPIRQSPETLAALRKPLEAYDNFRLAGLSHAVDVCGSFVLGLALAEGHITAQQVFEASELDATFQIQKWGEDPATTKRRAGIMKDLQLCEAWFELL